MKKGIHPENYRPVVFKDMSNGDMFLSQSTCKTNDTVEFEGETYPVVKIESAFQRSCIYVGMHFFINLSSLVQLLHRASHWLHGCSTAE